MDSNIIDEPLLFSIEKKYPELNSFEVNGVKIWSFFRNHVKFELLKLGGEITVHQSVYSANPKIKFSLYLRYQILFLRTYLKIFFKWKRPSYIILSNRLEKKNFKGNTIDKLNTGLLNELGESNFLFIEDGRITNRESFIHKNVSLLETADLDILMALTADVELEFTNGTLDGLNKILDEIGVKPVQMTYFQYFFKRSNIFKKLFSVYKPKIFFSSCYSYYAEIHAANISKIKTVELQHGIISETHTAYYSPLKIDKSCTSQTIFTFGDNSFKSFNHAIYQPNHVIPIGNYYLELLKSEPVQDLDISKMFLYNVAVPLDYISEDELLNFVVKISEIQENICFHLIPRENVKDNTSELIKKFSNIKIVKNKPYQEFVRSCDVNLSTDSTCCLEALNLGIPNILYNIDNKAYTMFSDKVDPKFTLFVTSAGEFVEKLAVCKTMLSSEIMDSQIANYQNGYSKNVRKAIDFLMS